MRKLIKILKNKQGMTMMELIIGMLISVIIAVSVSSALAPMMTFFFRTNDISEANTLVDNVAEEILNDLSRATAITVDTDEIRIATNIGDVVYENLQAGSVLTRNNIPVFDERYYKMKTMRVELSETADAFLLTLTVMDRDGPLTPPRVYAVDPLFRNSKN